jgi:hypothetical protein
MNDVTRILAIIDSGDPAAADQLLPLGQRLAYESSDEPANPRRDKQIHYHVVGSDFISSSCGSITPSRFSL